MLRWIASPRMSSASTSSMHVDVVVPVPLHPDRTLRLHSAPGRRRASGFAGGPKTHGQSDRHRSPGSIGACATPGRVWKGMRMGGRMGNARVTAQGQRIELVDPERNLLAIRGSVPGANGGVVMIKQARKSKALQKRRGE